MEEVVNEKLSSSSDTIELVNYHNDHYFDANQRLIGSQHKN